MFFVLALLCIQRLPNECIGIGVYIPGYFKTCLPNYQCDLGSVWTRGCVSSNCSSCGKKTFTSTLRHYKIISLVLRGTVVYSNAACFFCRWKYMCVELLSSLQRSYPGSNYQLLQVRLYKDTGNYYIDTVQLGRTATVSETNG